MKTILVTGGNGFLGKHLKEKFKKASALNIIYPSSKEVNLLRQDAVMDLFERERPDTVLHMAAICGGIGANKESPADFVHLNSKMTCNIFDAVLKYGTESLYTLGSVCSYPKHCPVPFKEEDLWNGYPEETNAPYGTAKRLQLVMQQSFMQQYGLKGAHLIPVNMYGECFSKDTRLATPDGWKNVADFEIGDDIWTLNPETHKVEKEKVTAVQKRKSKKFVNFKGSVIDLRVTPEHKIYYKTNKTFLKRKAEWFIPRAGKDHGMIRFATSKGMESPAVRVEMNDIGFSNFANYKKASTSDQIIHGLSRITPKNAKFSFESFISNTSLKSSIEVKDGKARGYKHSHSKWTPLEYDPHDFYEFVGWYVSEGSIVDATNQISISQSLKNYHHREQIKALLTRMNIEFSFDDHRFYFSSNLWKEFIIAYIGKGSDSKKIPDFMMDSTPELLEVLFDALMKGDGDSDGGRYTTKSEVLKDQFMIILMLTGRTVGKVCLDDGCWRIPIRLKRKNSVKYRDIKVEELDEEEEVFCVTAGDNHIVYAERNNKPCWVGQCDHFDLEKSHVIPALIRKFVEAKENGDPNVTCWGTGSATREFLYAGDAAEAISYAVLSNFSNPEPINLGVGYDISIKDLATKISDIIGYEGDIIWDTTKPDGQPKRMLDVSRAEELLGFKASTSFDDGLRKTIEWYMYNQVG